MVGEAETDRGVVWWGTCGGAREWARQGSVGADVDYSFFHAASVLPFPAPIGALCLPSFPRRYL